MARKAIVTRTIIGTKVTLLGLNNTTEVPEKKEIILSGKIKDESIALKEAKKYFKDSDYTVAKVSAIEPINTMFGMWEEDFIAHAMKLDPETRKPIDA